MDEVVFARETLRRALLDAVKMLEEAAEKYDPEDVPVHDAIALFGVTSMPVRQYRDALKLRLEQRTGTSIEDLA